MAETTQTRLLMLPEDPGYYEILHGYIPPWEMAAHHDSNQAMVVDATSGLLRAVDFDGVEDYFYGGELGEIEERCDGN